MTARTEVTAHGAIPALSETCVLVTARLRWLSHWQPFPSMTIQENDIRAELSYAYFHAVVSRAGFVCGYSNRLADGLGIDAMIQVQERLAADSTLTDFSVQVQLKSTSQEPSLNGGKFSYPLEVDMYNKLRNPLCDCVKLLVLMYLPADATQWLTHSEDGLVSRRCAYWTSLLKAPETPNQATKTIYVPKVNLVSVDGLRALMARISRQEEILYDG